MSRLNVPILKSPLMLKQANHSMAEFTPSEGVKLAMLILEIVNSSNWTCL